MEPCITDHRRRKAKTPGDGLPAAFPAVNFQVIADAMERSLRIQAGN